MSMFRKVIDRVVDVYFGIPSTTTKKENNMTCIVNDSADRVTLFVDGEKIGSYSRRRDAVRGAKRRGLTVS